MGQYPIQLQLPCFLFHPSTLNHPRLPPDQFLTLSKAPYQLISSDPKITPFLVILSQDDLLQCFPYYIPAPLGPFSYHASPHATSDPHHFLLYSRIWGRYRNRNLILINLFFASSVGSHCGLEVHLCLSFPNALWLFLTSLFPLSLNRNSLQHALGKDFLFFWAW